MYEERVELVNDIGLHARPASIFIREAVKHACDVTVIKDGRSYNAKSIMSVLSMNADRGDELTIRAQGDDEEACVKALVDLIENKLRNL